MIFKITIFLTACILLISCAEKTDPTAPKPDLYYLKNNVWLSSGNKLVTGKPVVRNTLTGEQVKPCDDSIIIAPAEETKPNIKQKKSITVEKNPKTGKAGGVDCNIKVVDPSEELQAAIRASQSEFSGTITKNGKSIPFTARSQITFLYKGSFCTTTYIGGDQYTVCLEETSACISYKNFIEPGATAYYKSLGKTDEEI